MSKRLQRRSNCSPTKTQLSTWRSPWLRCQRSQPQDHCKWASQNLSIQKSLTPAFAWSWKTLKLISESKLKIWISLVSPRSLVSIDSRETLGNSRTNVSFWEISMCSWQISESTRCCQRWWEKNFTPRRHSLALSKSMVSTLQLALKTNWIKRLNALISPWAMGQITAWESAWSVKTQKTSLRMPNLHWLKLLDTLLAGIKLTSRASHRLE